jgi:hypothetical protein
LVLLALQLSCMCSVCCLFHTFFHVFLNDWGCRPSSFV